MRAREIVKAKFGKPTKVVNAHIEMVMNLSHIKGVNAIGLFMIPTQMSIVLWLRFVSSGHVTSSC